MQKSSERGKREQGRRRFLLAMFCLGVFSVFAQVMFMRELFVVFFGNELSIGGALACWFVGIGLGALASDLLSRFGIVRRSIRWVLFGVLVALAAALPFQVYYIRIARTFFSVSAGEYAPLLSLLLFTLSVFLPTSFGIGLFFPFACEAGSGGDGADGRRDGQGYFGDSIGSISGLYVIEAAGSMSGGVLLSYVLLPLASPYMSILLACSAAFAGASVVAPKRSVRRAVALGAVITTVIAIAQPSWLRAAEEWTVSNRWKSWGVTGTRAHLAANVNSVYQNLAVIESEGQFTLYANGQALFAFPSEYESEHQACFIMAQAPRARQVLVLGGNPVGIVREFLDLGVTEVVYVSLDPDIGNLVSKVTPEAYAEVTDRPGLTVVSEDPAHFVKRCTRKFDFIVLDAPEPATLAANRFYTRSFYRNAEKLLRPGGFFYTSVGSAVRLRSAVVHRNASIYKALKSCFDKVLVTAGDRNGFFAAGEESGLTFDRQVLYERSKQFRGKTSHFLPEFFLASEKIRRAKVEEVTEKFEDSGVPVNTVLNPVTYFFSLLLWSRYSGSGMERFLSVAGGLEVVGTASYVVAAGVLCVLAGLMMRTVSKSSGVAAGNLFARGMTAFLIATSGFVAIAMEILLLFVFQSLYGYVYTRIGLVTAVFMLGLVAGGWCGRKICAGRCRQPVPVFLCLIELMLAAVAAAVPVLVMRAARIESPGALHLLEGCVYAAVAAVGTGVGMEFPLANSFLLSAGGRVRSSAAITDASDHIGAALGSVAVGVLLLPVLGIGSVCVLLATLKASGLLLVVSAWFSRVSIGGNAGNGRGRL
jgi:spermidine synthase